MHDGLHESVIKISFPEWGEFGRWSEECVHTIWLTITQSDVNNYITTEICDLFNDALLSYEKFKAAGL